MSDMSKSAPLSEVNNQPHIANTYVALVMLLILGDDLSQVRRSDVAESLRRWQLEDGSCMAVGNARWFNGSPVVEAWLVEVNQ